MFSVQSSQINWVKILSSRSKNPYGTYAATQYHTSLFDSLKLVRFPLETLLESHDHILSISNRLSLEEENLEEILYQVSLGKTLILSAEVFDEVLLDTLNLETTYDWMYNVEQEYKREFLFSVEKFFQRDTASITFTNTTVSDNNKYLYRKEDITHYFSYIGEGNSVLIEDVNQRPLAVRHSLGQGNIILVSAPLIFTNIYFLHNNNEQLVRSLLSYVEGPNLTQTEYYELGFSKLNTPLRYILSQPALKFALYLVMALLILFVIFEVKRRQKAIPIITPPRNQTLEFTKTIGNLYFENYSHKSLANKRIQFFLDHIRSHYQLETHTLDEEFQHRLSNKSGVDKKKIKELLDQIIFINSKNSINDTLLKSLSQAIDDFYQKTP